MLAPPDLSAALADRIADALAGPGWVVLPALVPRPLTRALRQVALALAARGDVQPAGVGRDQPGSGHRLDPRIRNTLIHWLDGTTAATASWAAFMEALRLALNQRLMLALFEAEMQLAIYPPGGFYARHRDSLRGSRNRLVSIVLYLDEDWDAADGGALEIFDGDTIVARILPEAGTLVLMLSEEVEHAVAATRRTRHAVAGWLRVNTPGRVG